MKRFLSMALAIIISVSLFVSGVPVFAASSELTVNDFYGRTALSKMSRGSTYVAVYDHLYECVENGDAEIDVSAYNISTGELDMILMAYFGDPTGHFWFTSNGSYDSNTYTGQALAFFPLYNSLVGRTDNDRAVFVKRFEKSVDSFIASLPISSRMSEYEKELIVHDALAMLIEYDDAEFAHSAYGALLEYIAVCEGYTYAFGYILAKLGILSHAVYGYSRNQLHTWNLVKIDGSFYYLDLTWNDQTLPGSAAKGIDVFYEYFNVTTQVINRDHSIITPAYGLPQCTATEANYFSKNPQNVVNSNTDAKTVAKLWNDHAIRIYFDGTATEFNIWISDIISDVAYYCGYDFSKPISLNIRSMPEGNEVHLFFTGTLLPSEEPDILLGDLDGDNKVTAIDSNLIRRILSGTAEKNDSVLIRADMDGDGSLSGIDSNLLKRLIAGS
ncbi:MAG: hypothetical protein IJD22_06440 [Clostridia bacterium]|nr:hypothetical protein [Clostridia bacterium]